MNLQYTTELPMRLLSDADQVASMTPMRTNHFQKVSSTMYKQTWSSI